MEGEFLLSYYKNICIIAGLYGFSIIFAHCKVVYNHKKENDMDFKQFENDVLNQDNSRRQVLTGNDGYRSLAFPALMRKVYVWMALAMVITGLTAFGVASSPNILMALMAHPASVFVIFAVEIGLVIYLSARLDRMSLTTATTMFVLYSVLNGVALSSVFLVYTMQSITQVFFITAGTFGAMALIGSTTKRDLTGFGGILMMLLIGLIIASLVNIFVGSSMFDLVLSYITVAIFVGLTAYDAQKIRQMLALQEDGGESAQKLALMGALDLYLDFINLFLALLRIFGNRNN